MSALFCVYFHAVFTHMHRCCMLVRALVGAFQHCAVACIVVTACSYISTVTAECENQRVMNAAHHARGQLTVA